MRIVHLAVCDVSIPLPPAGSCKQESLAAFAVKREIFVASHQHVVQAHAVCSDASVHEAVLPVLA